MIVKITFPSSYSIFACKRHYAELLSRPATNVDQRCYNSYMTSKQKKPASNKKSAMSLIFVLLIYFGSIPLSILFIMYLEKFGDSTYILREFIASILALAYLSFAIYFFVPILVMMLAAFISRFPKGAEFIANHPYIGAEKPKNK